MATERRAVPYVKIAKMVGDGKSTEQIARAIGRYDSDKPDPTKRVRALLWMMRHHGFKTKNGETAKLKKVRKVIPGRKVVAVGGKEGL